MLVLPDTTVLINFALIQRMDLLEQLANNRGQWCATVAQECRQSASRPGLAALHDVGRFLGAPIYASQDQLRHAQILRTQLASPGDSRQAHLGEAETLAIMTKGDLFVSDDDAALRLATTQGMQTARTWSLLRLAAKQGWVEAPVLLGYIRQLKDAGRAGAPGGLDSVGSVLAWIRS
jgi:predicted nucleic acid-binding protein